MLRTSIAAAVLFALACTPLCFAQDKPADAAALPGAKPITLQLEATSPEEAFAELAKQADVQIKPVMPGLWAKADPVELKIENGRFWPVFIDMCQQANVKFNPPYYSGEPRTVQLFGSDQGMESLTKFPFVESSGCVIAVMSANRSYSLSYGERRQPNTSFGIQAILLCDPGVQMTGSPQVHVIEAVDENGTSFAPPANQNTYYGSDGRSMSRNVYMNLSYPTNAGKKLVRLKGEIKTTITAKSETLTIEPLTDVKPQKKDLSNMSVEVKSVKVTDNSAEVKVTMQMKRAMQGMEYQNMWGLLNAMELLDEKGNHYNISGNSSNMNSQTTFNATVQFTNPNPAQIGKPAKVSWVLPVETKDVSLPFEFKDLPIP